MWSRQSAQGFFLTRRPTSLVVRRVLVLRMLPRAMSERLLVLAVPATTGRGFVACCRGAATSAAIARSPTILLRYLSGGPAQGRTHFVGHHLPLGAPFPVLGFPAALLETTRHHH